ncbi:MAG: 4-hydroxy-tetrahydrodipicolinate synthase [Terrimonas sp.]|nr:4-hydroxy-tetrahydrodipicolinate synthase [Terrimonas sp.]OJY93255.1 MAG: 4-hydroxy-tetrahydrodipicolinate synthase [Sphingobacteriales bacterium 40-81]
MSLRAQLSGTGVAIVTPFKTDYSVDYPALERVIDFIISNGVEYIVTLGTTGEAPTISKEEKFKIIEFTYEKVNNRVPVVVGIGGNNTAEAIHDLETYPLKHATAVLSVSPYYSKPSQEGLYMHYKALAETSPRPILLYNVPGRTGRNLIAETTLRLGELPNIAGIKEAAGDMMQCMQVLKYRPEHFLVSSGDDALGFSQIACGMDGVISVIANCMPRQYSDMVRFALAGKLKEAIVINDSLLDVYEMLFVENNPAGVKSFLAHLGLIENVLRLPVVPVSNKLHEKIGNYLHENVMA